VIPDVILILDDKAGVRLIDVVGNTFVDVTGEFISDVVFIDIVISNVLSMEAVGVASGIVIDAVGLGGGQIVRFNISL